MMIEGLRDMASRHCRQRCLNGVGNVNQLNCLNSS